MQRLTPFREEIGLVGSDCMESKCKRWRESWFLLLLLLWICFVLFICFMLGTVFICFMLGTVFFSWFSHVNSMHRSYMNANQFGVCEARGRGLRGGEKDIILYKRERDRQRQRQRDTERDINRE